MIHFSSGIRKKKKTVTKGTQGGYKVMDHALMDEKNVTGETCLAPSKRKGHDPRSSGA